MASNGGSGRRVAGRRAPRRRVGGEERRGANVPIGLFAVDRRGICTLADGAGLALLALPDGQHVGREYADLCGHMPDSVAAMHRALAGEVVTAVDVYRGAVLETRWTPTRDADGTVSGAIGVSSEAAEERPERRTRAALRALLAMAEALVQAPQGPDARAALQAIVHRLGVLTCEVLGCRSVGIIGVGEDGVLFPLDCVGLTPAQLAQWHERVRNWPYQTDVFRGIVARLRAGEVSWIDTTIPDHQSMANPFGIARYLLAPMRIGAVLVGMLSINYGEDAWTTAPDDAALVEAIAKLAALVIERERLQQEREEAHAHALALEEANRRMDEFLGIAGHEMRTPLTSIGGHIQLAHRHAGRLIAQDAGSAEMMQGLITIHRLLDRTDAGLLRINRLVSDLLDVSRIHAGHLDIRVAPTDLAAIVQEVVDEQRELAAAYTILLTGSPSGSVPVIIDVGRIAQVLTNYLSNALKYSPLDKPVMVGLDVEGSSARVWVRDEGPGVSRDDQERIWARFYRVPEAGRRHGSSVGLGLGLHISRLIVEKHGGQVGVESVPGAGATFWFTLPVTHPV